MLNSTNKRRLPVILLLVVAILFAGIASYKLIKKYHPQWLNFSQAPFGLIDKLSEDSANSTQTKVAGWALAKAGVSRVELVLDDLFHVPLQASVTRPDVAQIYPDYPDSEKSGFDGVVDTSRWIPGWHTMEVAVIDKKGKTSVIGRRTRPALHKPLAPVGLIEKFSEDNANSTRTTVIGWALAKGGVDRVELVLDNEFRIPLQIAVPRPDVAQICPACPDSAKAGFEGIVDTSRWVADWHTMEVIATDKKGGASVIGRRTQTVIDKPRAPIGLIEKFSEDTADSTQTKVIGWALAKDGVDRVELVLDGQFRIPLQVAVTRTDVAQIYPDYPDSEKAGFDGIVDTSRWTANWHTMEVIVTGKNGKSSVIGRRTQPAINAMDVWKDLLDARGVKRDDIFYFIMATSSLSHGGAREIDTVFRRYESATVKVGMRVPILYLRTTKGKAGDYAFDPDFPLDKKCGQRALAEDNLQGVIDYAVTHKLPVLFTLNGGIWADAACDVPDWDINDMLEQDIGNCQWNQKNEVLPDNHLKQLSGSMESPELARSLSFNIYAKKNRRYKKRNLQQAAALIRAFATRHPDLFIGVTLDPDTYVNPFFDGRQWYDFNPGTLRQFREWLRGAGPYASRPAPGQPDLSRFRKQNPLTLEQVNALSGAHFKTWDEVDPPRSSPTLSENVADDPWTMEWEHFRRHLVAQHYEELALWVRKAGIDKDSIYSGQGFMAPAKSLLPFAIHLNSPLKNYDTGGMSIEGAIPSNGHLGAILYGASAANQIRMEAAHSLFSTFRRLDPGWAVVEHNTADLHEPTRLPGFAEAYRSIREIHNHGARFISPMAWNGSRGIFAGQPGFVAYTALRDSPLEDAIKMFMISHANLPRRSRLWTFGAGTHADGDGWVPSEATQGRLTPGKFILRCTPGSPCSLESPDDLAFKPAEYQAIVIKAAEPEVIAAIGLEGQTPDGKWLTLLATTELAKLKRVKAGLLLPLPEALGNTEFSRIRLNWKSALSKPLALEHIAFYVR